jgi:hypothetical protein
LKKWVIKFQQLSKIKYFNKQKSLQDILIKPLIIEKYYTKKIDELKSNYFNQIDSIDNIEYDSSKLIKWGTIDKLIEYLTHPSYIGNHH